MEEEEEAYERRKLEKKIREKEIAYQEVSFITRPRGYKTFFMLNSTEHEILTAYKN